MPRRGVDGLMVHRILAVMSVMVLAGAGCTPAACDEGISVDDGWVRALVPGRYMTAAYAELHNCGGAEVTIDSVSTELFGLVEIHETTIVDGVSRMREVGPLTLAPGESVLLEPGGKHLMLMRAAAGAGDATEVVFSINLADGRTITAALPVRAADTVR